MMKKKKKLRFRVIELAQKSLAYVAGVKWGKRAAGRKEERLL